MALRGAPRHHPARAGLRFTWHQPILRSKTITTPQTRWLGRSLTSSDKTEAVPDAPHPKSTGFNSRNAVQQPAAVNRTRAALERSAGHGSGSRP